MGAVIQYPDGKTDSVNKNFNLHFGSANNAVIE